MKEFLVSDKYIDYDNPLIQDKAKELFNDKMDDVEKAKIAYEFVRDEIRHSFDYENTRITAKASDVLKYRAGICHTKSNLLAALLRSQKIPTGFRFQHLTLMDDDSAGYCIHCYNAVFLCNKWIELDARGNRPGVNAQFSLDKPTIAFPNRPQYDEYTYEGIYARPNIDTMILLENTETVDELIKKRCSILSKDNYVIYN